jgi:hypothetical protein
MWAVISIIQWSSACHQWLLAASSRQQPSAVFSSRVQSSSAVVTHRL